MMEINQMRVTGQCTAHNVIYPESIACDLIPGHSGLHYDDINLIFWVHNDDDQRLMEINGD